MACGSKAPQSGTGGRTSIDSVLLNPAVGRSASTAVRFVQWISDATNDLNPPADIAVGINAHDMAYTRAQFSGPHPPAHMTLVDSADERYAFGFTGLDSAQYPGGSLWLTVATKGAAVNALEVLSIPEPGDQIEIIEMGAEYLDALSKAIREGRKTIPPKLRADLRQIFAPATVDSLTRRVATGRDAFAGWISDAALPGSTLDAEADPAPASWRVDGFDAVIPRVGSAGPARARFTMTIDGWKIAGW